MRSFTKLMSIVAFAGLLSSCGIPGAEEEEPEEPTPIPEDATATTDEQEVAIQAAITEEWSCGAVKQHVHTVVNNLRKGEDAAYELARAYVTLEIIEAGVIEEEAVELPVELPGAIMDAATNLLSGEGLPSSNDEADDEEDIVSTEKIIEAFQSTLHGFTVADQLALNAACELYGQHQSALELWLEDERGDACDVWKPAKGSADAQEAEIDVAVLHPITSKFWVGATGSIAEGYGKCIARLNN